MARPRRVKRILNIEPSRDTHRDWRMEHARDAGVLPRVRAALPASVDLREDWWKIGDQGSTGSCVGWATGDSVLRWHFVKAGRMAADHKLSPRFLWMASKEIDQLTSQPTTFIESAGTTLKSALDVARRFGAVRDSILPFSGERVFYRGQSKTFYAVAATLKIGSYFNISLNTGHDLEDWRTWLATKGPILTRLDVDDTWDDAKANAGNMDVYKPETTRGGHAVALVGYTPDRFIVRNSWGTTGWGDQGFGYASLAYAQQAFTEAYGVSL
jgi:hypothetical protein